MSLFMIKYSKFTENIGLGNFTDIFCQNADKFKKMGGGGGGVVTSPRLTRPLYKNYNFFVKIHNVSEYFQIFVLKQEF